MSTDNHFLGNCQNNVCLTAPAKINLGLSIVGRRLDGYHLLESLFWPINLADEIQIEFSERFAVETFWADDAATTEQVLPDETENLAYKAMMRVFPGSLPKWRIRIRKHIPLGGGLGGGSSDVGALLRYLLSSGAISNEKAAQVAERLGADVPFFLQPVPTWVTGTGEKRLVLAADPNLFRSVFFLLVLFPFPTPTQTVFNNYRAQNHGFSLTQLPPGFLTCETLRVYLSAAQNDLEQVVGEKSPLIAKILHALRVTPCVHAGLSGSGSTCFAIYFNKEDREKSLKDLLPLFRDSNCRGIVAETFLGK